LRGSVNVRWFIPTTAPGSGATATYFDKLREGLAARFGSIFVAEAAGKFAGVVTGLIESYDMARTNERPISVA